MCASAITTLSALIAIVAALAARISIAIVIFTSSSAYSILDTYVLGAAQLLYVYLRLNACLI